MGEKFPFFHHDIIARIIPGALTLYVLWSWGLFTLPAKVGAFADLSIATVLLGLSYAIGLSYEAVYSCRSFSEKLLTHAFVRVAAKYEWRRSVAEMGSVIKAWEPQLIRRRVMNWLVLTNDQRQGRAFAHVLRFQAESKLFLHAIIPGMALTYLIVRPHSTGAQPLVLLPVTVLLVLVILWNSLSRADSGRLDWFSFILLVLAIFMVVPTLVFKPTRFEFISWSWALLSASIVGCLLCRASLHREVRRWLQILISLDEMNDHKDPDLIVLQLQCERLSTET